MNQTRFSRRMYEHFPFGASYGCAIERYERRSIPLHVWAMVAIGVVGLVVILITA